MIPAEIANNPNVQAFLTMLRYGEGTSGPNGYRTMFGGSLFDDYADHPRKAFKSKWGWTSAAGAYQAMCAVPGKVKTDTWGDFIRAEGPHDFTPPSQDQFALWCIRRRGAMTDVLAGRFDQAVAKCNREWASLPGSPYGQPVVTLKKARDLYASAGGAFAATAPVLPQPLALAQPTALSGDKPMAPFILAALPAIFDAVPKLISLFGSHTEVGERNAKAIESVVEIAKAATGAMNEQDLTEKLANDPEAAGVVRQAVEAQWFQITDAAGVGDARKADAVFVATGEAPWRSPSFLIACALLPLVYLIVGAVVGVVGEPFSDDVRSAIANGVIGLILGGLIGYYYGQTTTRNRTSTATTT